MYNSFEEGQMVKFNPTREGWEDDYTLDGVWPGDKGTVTIGNECVDDVWVNFIRAEGTICEGFCAFPEDLELVNDVA